MLLAQKLLMGGSSLNIDALMALFGASELGGLWLPGYSTMWQDSARTTPATAANDPVGAIDDLSGNGNHLLQATAGSRPTLQQTSGLWYLQFDGTADNMTAAFDLSTVDKSTVIIGVEKQDDTLRFLAEYTASFAANTGSFVSYCGTDTVVGYFATSRGNAGVSATFKSSASTFSGVDRAVMTATHDIAGDNTTVYVDQAAAAAGTGNKGTGNWANSTLYVGARGGTTSYFNGKLFGLCVRGALASGATLTDAEDNMNEFTGAY